YSSPSNGSPTLRRPLAGTNNFSPAFFEDTRLNFEQAPDGATINLERCVFRQLIDKTPRNWNMGRQQVIAKMPLKFGETRVGDTRFNPHCRGGNLPQSLVTDTDNSYGRDRLMEKQSTLYRFRKDLEPAPHDRAIGAAMVEHESILIDDGDIGGPDPIRSDAGN